MLLSVIVPCYNEEEAIPLFYERTTGVLSGMRDIEYEYIFVNDGSKDKTLEVVKNLAARDVCVKYISFSRNFGKESAMYAGLQYCRGELIAIMDVDLQDPPELLPDMYDGIVNGGHDCVATCRKDRKGEPPVRSFFARLFYKLINKISSTDIVDGARDFRLMTRAMVDSILAVSEYNRFSKGIFGWVGFDIKWIPFENQERVAGETKWSFWKLFKYSLDGIFAFSVAPLTIASVLGVLCCGISFLMICVIIFKTLVWGDPVAGYPSMICFMFFIGGLQFLCLGILGQYLSKTYLETKNRPIYICKETNMEKYDKNNLVK